MTHSREIDRQESMPDCPECEHNLFVHPAAHHEWVCESCETEWGDLKRHPAGGATRKLVTACLRERLADQGSPTYLRARDIADSVGIQPAQLSVVLTEMCGRVDDDIRLAKDNDPQYDAIRWRVQEVAGDGD